MPATINLSPADELLSLIRTEFRNLPPRELLHQSPHVLLGVNAATAAVLKSLEINTVFDLATSTVFDAATKLLSAGSDLKSALYQHGSPTADLVREADAAGKKISELQFLPIGVIESIPAAQVANVQSALDVQTVRDLALYPPYRAAVRILNAIYFPENTPAYDPERPVDLLPKTGEYPTERVQYTTLLMDEIKLGDGEAIVDIASPSFKPLDLAKLALGDAGFKQIAFGALLTFNQSWYAQGVTLGQLLHSTSLAPGESTRVAVVDWSRKSRAGETEVIDETDDLSNDTSHNRSINEVTQAVANEAQSGFSQANSNSTSTQEGTSSAAEASAPLGGLFGGPSGSVGHTSSSATTNSHADSYSTSFGHRDIGSSMMQNVNDRTHQHAHSSRSRRASVVKEVSQTEHESVSTRVIANYNHMHALTIQYYEVVQVYRVEVAIVKADKVVFIPIQLADFNNDAVVRRFQNVLARAALTFAMREALQNLDVLEVAPERDTHFTILGSRLSSFLREALLTRTSIGASAGLRVMRAAPAADAPATADAAAPALVAQPLMRAALTPIANIRVSDALPIVQQVNDQLWSADQAARLSGLLNRAVLRADSNAIFLPTDVLVEGGMVAGGAPLKIVFHTHQGAAVRDVSADHPLALSEVSRIALSGSSAERDISATVVLTVNRNGVRFPLELPAVTVAKGAADETRVVQIKPGGVNANLKQHLNDNRMYYSQAIFRSLDSTQIAMLLSGYGLEVNGQMVPVAQVVEPRPIRYVGNYLAFKMNTDAASDETWSAWLREHGIRLGATNDDIVPLPSGGTFAEAVLGRSNSAEKLDITRFWNWQDSPIPLQPTEIAAIQTGSRATNEDVKPGQLSNPIINITSPTSLPDPSGTAAILAAIQNGNMFRDMSGLQSTIALAQAALQATSAGAATAGEQAGTNMNNLLKANTERQRIAAEMITSLAKTAAGVFTGGLAGGGGGGISGSNHSQDGAKINYFDGTKTPAPQGGGGGGSTGGSAGGGAGSSGGSSGGDSTGGGGNGAAPMADEYSYSQNPAALAATWGDGQPRSALFQKVLDKVPDGSIGTDAGAGSPDGGAAAKVSPFPSKYPAGTTADAKLQKALDDARAGVTAAQKTIIAGVPITIIALAGGAPHAIASFHGAEMDYSASLLKVAALYAAHELRAAAQRLADTAHPADTAQLIAALQKQFDPAIKSAVPSIVNTAGIKDEHVLPHYDQVLQLNGTTVEFTAAYTTNLEGMIVGGHNPEAANCIHGLGYGYINGALAAAGFFDTATSAGIWLCGDFTSTWPYVRVASANDQDVAQATTTDQMARLFALMADGTLPGSAEMLALLKQAGKWFHNPATPPVIWAAGEPVEVTHAKVGLGPLKSGPTVASEGEIVHEKPKDVQFAVVWQNLKGGATQANLQAVARVVKAAIEAFVGP